MGRKWVFILLSLIISAAASWAITANTPPKYAATISMLVSAYDKGKISTTTAYQAVLLSQQRVKSYANLLTSRRVVGQITGEDDIKHLQENISVETIPDTVLLRATITDLDPARAARLANSLGTAFIQLIDQLERPTQTAPPTVKVTMVDQAETSTTPVSPRPLVNIAFAVTVAMFASVSTLILRDRLDTTIKTSEALRQVSDSAVLGMIDYERDARHHPLIVREQGRSHRSEAFRSLRTNLQFIGVDRQPKSLVITSCLPGEGKSSTSTNLAITLAQAGWRVLLVDADLRRPSIPDYMGIEGAVGLTDVLIDKAGLEEVVQNWSEPNLRILPSGRIPPNPSELLGSRGMRQILARLGEAHDMVIIDAPPLLPVADAATLAAVCDGTLLVARYGKTRREHVARAMELLTSVNARMVGSVLNFTPAKSGSAYGYGYASHIEQAEMIKTPTTV